MYFFSCTQTLHINDTDQNQGTDQARQAGKEKDTGIHFFNKDRYDKGEKSKTDKEVHAKLQILVRYSSFQKLIGQKQDHQNNKKGHCF